MDTTEVEKFFALWKDDGQEKGETQMVNTRNITVVITINKVIVDF